MCVCTGWHLARPHKLTRKTLCRTKTIPNCGVRSAEDARKSPRKRFCIFVVVCCRVPIPAPEQGRGYGHLIQHGSDEAQTGLTRPQSVKFSHVIHI